MQDERLKQIIDQLNILSSLCVVLGLDFKLTVCSVHPSLDGSCGTKSISVNTIESLSSTIRKLKDVKLQRMQKVHICSKSSSFGCNYSFSLTLAYSAPRSCNGHGRALESDGHTG